MKYSSLTKNFTSMKKSLLLFLCFFALFFTGKINAQWSIVPNIGVNNTRITYYYNNFNKTNLEAANFLVYGIAAHYSFGKKIAFETNAQSSTKGNTLIRTSYLDVIQCAEYTLIPNLSFYSGVIFGFNMKEQRYDGQKWINLPPGFGSFNEFCISGLLGVRAKYDKVQLSFHADRSITDFSIFKNLHLVYQLTLGYKINLDTD